MDGDYIFLREHDAFLTKTNIKFLLKFYISNTFMSQ